MRDAEITAWATGGARNAFLFYALALGLALAVRLLLPVLGHASLAATMMTPTIAAAIMLVYLAPEGGVRASLAGLGLTSFGLRGWPLALLGPALIFAVGLAILAALGLTRLAAPQVQGSGAGVALNLLVGLVAGTLFALCEEVGWRGYMLPQMMRGFGVVAAMLIVGLLHGVWHLPLLLTTDLYHAAGNPWIITPLFLITLTLAGVFYGYLRVTTGSVWPVAGAHSAVNIAWGISMEVSETKSTLVLEYIGGESGLLIICGLLACDAYVIVRLRSAPRTRGHKGATMAIGESGPRGGLVGAIRRNQVVAFVILAYPLSWWAWVWYRLDPENVGAPILPVGPLLAALILLPVIGGWSALKDLFRRIALWRVGWVWYLVVLAGPVVLTLAAVRINLVLGARPLESFQMPDAAGLAARFVFIFLWIGLGEEPGWRGFVLPRLLVGRSALSAALILGVIHAVWHLPLLGVEYFAWNLAPWTISVFCFSIVVAWIFRHTGGSVLMPMLMHASNNTVAVLWRMFEGDDQVRLWWVWAGFWVIATVAIVLTYGKELMRGKVAGAPT